MELSFKALGTTWNVKSPEGIGTDILEDIKGSIVKRLETFEQTYSRFRKDSVVSQMARQAGEYELPQDALPMLSLYRELYLLTDGLVTPLVGQVLSDAGYDAEYSLTPKEQIQPALSWEDTIEYLHPFLKVKKPVLLDFGALGKGAAIDIVSRMLEKRGVNEYLVEAGGDLAYKNTHNPLLVGLEDPEDFGKVVGVAELRKGSLCGSAGSRRIWRSYHHVMNPKTIMSPRHILGLWVAANSTLLADALATALFFVSPKTLSEAYRFEYAILYADRRGEVSDHFPGRFF